MNYELLCNAAVSLACERPSPRALTTVQLHERDCRAQASSSNTITAEYRAALGGWLENHKHYPENARARGEEGRCVLRFRVERSGRVQSYAIVASSGYADLDAAVEALMQGAVLPPFPAAMTAPAVEVSVTIRFALTRNRGRSMTPRPRAAILPAMLPPCRLNSVVAARSDRSPLGRWRCRRQTRTGQSGRH